MKIKLDENLGRRCVDILSTAGHEAASVTEQDLTGSDDSNLLRVCRDEDRCLLTLDLDFSNPLRFPPHEYAGIAVIRLPSRPSYEDLITAVHTFVQASRGEDLKRKLWIVEADRIRIYRPDNEDA